MKKDVAIFEAVKAKLRERSVRVWPIYSPEKADKPSVYVRRVGGEPVAPAAGPQMSVLTVAIEARHKNWVEADALLDDAISAVFEDAKITVRAFRLGADDYDERAMQMVRVAEFDVLAR